jgi:3-isopropylmalate/(R)-2-methylmalate dehydratase large subunit
MGKTAYQKIVDDHLVEILDDGRMVLKLDRVWCHEITTPNAILDGQRRGCDVVFNPNKVKAMIDHVNPAKDTASAIQGQIMRDWCNKHGVEFLDVGRNGVCHAIIPEKGWILPGEIGIMGDSHTCTHGAFSSLSAGVGTTELGHGIRTGLWICPPQKVIDVQFVGKLPVNVFSKDLILTLISRIGTSGATNSILEFSGDTVERMSMEARMTLTNMSVEAGATSGMVMVDETTVHYLWNIIKQKYGRDPALIAMALKEALNGLSMWNSDPDCEYDNGVHTDVYGMQPMITQGHSPGDVVPVHELAGKKINQVYIGSCTNGRMEDLRIAAHIFKKTGYRVHKNVRCIVVPATHNIWQQANKEGLLDIFMGAGCVVSYPTCGACLGMSNGVLAPGEVCVSTTNRNFPGRMGLGGMVHLASPATAAISALEGVITVPGEHLLYDFAQVGPEQQVCPNDWEEVETEKIDYIELASRQSGDAQDFSGGVFYLDKDNVDTDQIIPAKYLTETDMEVFGLHCLDGVGLTPKDRRKMESSRILVAGKNFGCGSSREHAVWALAEAGIKCVIAPSFARIFYNNMFSNGLLCIELPEEAIAQLFDEKPDKLIADWQECLLVSDDKESDFKAAFMISDFQDELIENGGSTGVMFKLASKAYNQNEED